jgi:phosphoribosylformylglycinamidine cyclo-ligase
MESGPARPAIPTGADTGMSAASASYKAAGVDYARLDEGKRTAMAMALATSGLLDAHGGRALDASRGEPAFAFELEGRSFAFVLEGLGTKSIIARQVLEGQGVNRFADVAYDTVAAILNDLCCVGALPLVVNAYFATGASEWYADAARAEALVEGWQRACLDGGCVWGGGESPSLAGLVQAGDIELAGAAVGAVPDGCRPLLGDRLQGREEIAIVASSGLHANGASLARLVAGRLPHGYQTRLPSGRSFGEALLDPSLLYVGLVRAVLDRALEVRYISHITGHGLLKLMRPALPFTYRVHTLPPVPEVLDFLVAAAELDPRAAYSTLNMGCGYALYCAPGAGEAVVEAARELGLDALLAGAVEPGPRRVVLEPVDVCYESEELDLTAARG